MAISKEIFLQQSIDSHGDRYDYSLIEDKMYVLRDTVTIICKRHGAFDQQVGNHKQGSGCTECAKLSRKIANKNYTKKPDGNLLPIRNQKLIDSIWR